MDILQVAPRYPPQSGGVESHVQQISEQLVDRGHNVTVVTADAEKEGKHRTWRNGVAVRRYQSLAPNDKIHFCPQIATAVQKADVDIVHAHNYHSFPLIFAAIGTGDHKFIVTTHYHGGSAGSIRDRLLSMYHPVGQWGVHRADEVIAVSEWERDLLWEDFGVEAVVIPNGVAVDRFATAGSKARAQPYLLTVGRLEEYKGVQYLIRAMEDLPEYELLVAGSGPYRQELEQVTREKGLEEQVTFLGYVADETLPELYVGAAVYITLSEFEAYGMTVAEAVAAGTPCVVNTTAALTEWTELDSCLGVDNLKPATISMAVKNAEQLTGTTTSVSGWETVANLTENLYESLLDN